MVIRYMMDMASSYDYVSFFIYKLILYEGNCGERFFKTQPPQYLRKSLPGKEYCGPDGTYTCDFINAKNFQPADKANITFYYI